MKKAKDGVLRNRLVHAARNSASIEEMCHRLGKDEEESEGLWDLLISKVPGAEDFLIRNECARLMRDCKENDDMEGLREARIEYMRAFTRLQENGLAYMPKKHENLSVLGLSSSDLVELEELAIAEVDTEKQEVSG